jgi:hypothetical protein
MRQDAYLATFVVGLLIGVALGYWIKPENAVRDSWRPTGDRRTMLNTRTGEVRMLYSGETVQEYIARPGASERESQMRVPLVEFLDETPEKQ